MKVIVHMWGKSVEGQGACLRRVMHACGIVSGPALHLYADAIFKICLHGAYTGPALPLNMMLLMHNLCPTSCDSLIGSCFTQPSICIHVLHQLQR